MGCSELSLLYCVSRLRSLMHVSALKATKCDRNQNLFPVAEIFLCGYKGVLYNLWFKTARRNQELKCLHGLVIDELLLSSKSLRHIIQP